MRVMTDQTKSRDTRSCESPLKKFENEEKVTAAEQILSTRYARGGLEVTQDAVGR